MNREERKKEGKARKEEKRILFRTCEVLRVLCYGIMSSEV